MPSFAAAYRCIAILFMALSVWLSGCASGGAPEDASKAKSALPDNQDMKLAWIWLPDPEPIAPAPEDYVVEALRYLNGDGVERDTKAAHELLNRAANEGDDKAAFLIGRLYEEGVGVAKDPEKGLFWIEEAARRGLPAAQTRMGVAYFRGEGRSLNTPRGVLWFKDAAAAGYPEAQYQLGIAYHLGRGVVRNEIEAVRWLESAAEQNHENSQYLVGDAYSDGWGVEEDLSWAARWYGRAAAQGHAQAQYKLGIFYLGGRGVPKNPVEAYKWISLGAEAGHSDALRLLRTAEKAMTEEEIDRAIALARTWRPFGLGAKPAKIADPASIAFAKYSLRQLGFRPGPIDGRLDPITRRALAAYQRSSGMAVDGKLTRKLLARLKSDRLARRR